MSEIAIKIEGLGKKYLIGHKKADSIKESFLINATRLLGRSIKEIEEFWALKDIDLTIKKGQAVGIIGKNGAGKSTLLKVLSRITHPTTGRFEINGRVSSLLEVGTGFHPELSGRENIYLNGTILGMTRSEIKSKFDEIVDFSGVEKFIDTPVKRYSSGMYVRLAFAVAAHLEPEILIIDEVLAVGDAEFQKKCLGKMDEVTKQGRTVLFVSHNMNAVRNLCDSGITIVNGRIEDESNQIETLVANYQNQFNQRLAGELDFSRRTGRGELLLNHFSIKDSQHQVENHINVGSQIILTLSLEALTHIRYSKIIIGIYDQMSICCLRLDSEVSNFELGFTTNQKLTLSCATDSINLAPGSYFVNVAIYGNGKMQDYLNQLVSFDVVNDDFFGTGREIEAHFAKLWVRNKWQKED